MSWLGFTFGYLGVACFASAMVLHQRRLFGRPLDPRLAPALRIAGSAFLLAAFIAAAQVFGWQVGLVAWIAMLATSAFALTQLLAFAPRWAFIPAAGLLLSAFVSVFV